MADKSKGADKRVWTCSVAANHDGSARVCGDGRKEKLEIGVSDRAGFQECFLLGVNSIPPNGSPIVHLDRVSGVKNVSNPSNARAQSGVTVIQAVHTARLERVNRNFVTRHIQ